MTFLLCYFVRRVVNMALAWLPPGRRTLWIDRGITITVFVALLALLAGLLGTLVPKVVEQSRTVFFKIEHAEWQVEFNGLLRRTVGEYLWRRSFGNPADPRYQEAFARYRAEVQTGSGIFAALPSWDSTMSARFDAQNPDKTLSTADHQTRFRQFWHEQWTQQPQDIPFDYDSFMKLKAARAISEAEFRKVFTMQLQILANDRKAKLEQLDFQIAQQDRLAAEWWDRDPTALSLRHYFNDEVPAWLSRSGASMQALIRACLAIPMQLGIALLLSFLITVDVHGIGETMDRLRDTRIRRYFDEIAAELSVFSRLLGKSLEAQIVIAALISVATFVAMWWLGVDNLYFLALIVFICNLIPVVGVLIATFALAIGSVLQPVSVRGIQMPTTPHIERHFTASDTVRDIVIGMSDGLTVPFALAAGLSGAVAATNVVVTAGLAEVAAGSIAMGLGGYLAAKTDAEHYATERATEQRETLEVPERETEEVADVFRGYGLGEDVVGTVVQAIISDRGRWVDFMMKFELGLESPDPRRAARSALTIAVSYIVGGMIPLAPYFVAPSIHQALLASVVVTAIALGVFGYIKGRFTVKTPWRSAWQTMAVGGLAAAVAFGLAKLIG